MISPALPKRHSVMFTWLLYYILLLLVPVSISGFVYLMTTNVLEKEITNSNSFLLKKVQQQMDSLLEQAARLSNEIAVNPRVNELLKMERPAQLNPYNLYQLVRNLQTYKMLNNSIDDFYIYLKNIDRIISAEGSFDSQSYYTMYFAGTGMTYSQWLRLVSARYRDAALPIRYENSLGEVANTIAFFRTIPLFSRGPASANIVITLDESRLINDVTDIGLLNQGSVLILDRNNRVLASSNHLQDYSELPYSKLGDGNGFIHQRFGGKDSVVSYITSQKSEWRYLVITPISVFWQKADYVRNLTLFSLALCLVAGGIITYFALRKNYNPLEKLIRLLEQYQGSSFDADNNEYSFIQQAIARAYAKLEKVNLNLKQQNKLLRSHFLSRLLQGKETDPLHIQERLTFHDIQFKSDRFAVMAFDIADFCGAAGGSGLSGATVDAAIVENFKKLQTLVTSSVTGLVGETNQAFFTDIDDFLVCLVNFGEGQNERAELVRVARAAQTMLKEKLKVRMLVAASNIHPTLAGIPEAFHEALQAMEYQKLLEIGEIILYEDLNGLPKGEYYYPLDKEQQLINCIKTGDLERSELILNEIFHNNFEKSILPVKIARCLMFNLVSTMIKTVDSINDAGRQSFLEELNPIERLLACESINDMKTELRSILKNFCAYIQRQTKERNKNRVKESDMILKDRVVEYVVKRYADPNLGITTIAQEFGVHPVHLSRTFLEEAGEGLLDFINGVRLRKSKELFTQMNNLDEVAKAVGYSNTRTFTRAFKKYEGTTPGKYKESEYIARGVG
jgi:AraC-like DNA-binding protein